MKKFLLVLTILCFLITSVFGTCPVYAQEFLLPAPGVRVGLSPEYNPPILKGIKVHPDNPFRFDFILDKGDSQLSNDALKDESSRLIKYFLASLTIPEKDLWVNLSPYEKNRIVPESFGQTEMGRDLLAEDYMLKQITASLIYPEGGIGKKFWKRIYEEAAKKFGTTNIPVNTFNKVWIVPEKAVVYENAKGGTAYVVESKLKVMLEQDYLALSHSVTPAKAGIQNKNDINALGSQIVREIIIPELTKEVNEDKNFSQLRQVYNSLILATWYKKKIKDSILEQVYADKNKVAGVNIDDPQEKERIYGRYLQAFKKGVFNYIKEEQDPLIQQVIPRKYFSGGLELFHVPLQYSDGAMVEQDVSINKPVTEVTVDLAMITESFRLQENVQDFITKLEEAKKAKQVLSGKYKIVIKNEDIDIVKDSSKTIREILKSLITRIAQRQYYIEENFVSISYLEHRRHIGFKLKSGKSFEINPLYIQYIRKIGDQAMAAASGGANPAAAMNIDQAMRSVTVAVFPSFESLDRFFILEYIKKLTQAVIFLEGHISSPYQIELSQLKENPFIWAIIRRSAGRLKLEKYGEDQYKLNFVINDSDQLRNWLGKLEFEKVFHKLNELNTKISTTHLHPPEMVRLYMEALKASRFDGYVRSVEGMLHGETDALTLWDNMMIYTPSKNGMDDRGFRDTDSPFWKLWGKFVAFRINHSNSDHDFYNQQYAHFALRFLSFLYFRSGIDPGGQPLDHAMLNSSILDNAMKTAVKARRDAILKILDGLADGETLTFTELTERLNQVAGYGAVRLQTVRNDMVWDEELRKRRGFLITTMEKTTVQRAVKARWDTELKILNGLANGEKLTIPELTERLNRVAGYEHVSWQTVRNDTFFDKRLNETGRFLSAKEKESIIQKVIKARRDMELNILNGLADGETLTITELTQRLNQMVGYKHVTWHTVANDRNHEEQLKRNTKWHVDVTGKESIRARRALIQRIVNGLADGETLTPAELTERLNQVPMYRHADQRSVEDDIAYLNAVKARCDKEWEILNRLPEGKKLMTVELTKRLNQVPGYEDVQWLTVVNDRLRDKRLKQDTRLIVGGLSVGQAALMARGSKDPEQIYKEEVMQRLDFTISHYYRKKQFSSMDDVRKLLGVNQSITDDEIFGVLNKYQVTIKKADEAMTGNGEDRAMNASDIIKIFDFYRTMNGFIPFSYSYSRATGVFESMMKRPKMASREIPGLMRMSKDNRLLMLFSNEGYKKDGSSHPALIKRASGSGYSGFVFSREWISAVFYWNNMGNLSDIFLVPPTMKKPRSQYSAKMLAFLGIKRDKVPELESDLQYQKDIHDELIRIARLLKEAALKKGIDPSSVRVAVMPARYISELSPSPTDPQTVTTNLQILAALSTYQEIQQGNKKEDNAQSAQRGTGDQAMFSRLFRAPLTGEEGIAFKRTRLWRINNAAERVIMEIKQFAQENELDWRSSFSQRREGMITQGIAHLLKNLIQHEYRFMFPSVYYRIYRSSDPVDGIRLEFWGPAKHKLPQHFKDGLADGGTFKWFDNSHRPWLSIAPDDAVQGGLLHLGVSVMLIEFGNSVKVGWREDKKSNGHVIALHFPIKIRDNAQLAQRGTGGRAIKVRADAAMQGQINKEQITNEVKQLISTVSEKKARLFGKLGRLDDDQDTNSKITQWLLSEQLFPDKMLFQKLWNTIVVLYTSGSKDIVDGWLQILSQKWLIPQRKLSEMMLWMIQNKIGINDVSENNLDAFFRVFVENHQQYPNLGPTFVYNCPPNLDANEKINYARANIERMTQMSSPDFVKNDVVLKSNIPGTKYFIGMQYSLAESTNGFYVTLGVERNDSRNPLKGVIFRIGLDTQGDDLRIIMMQGVKNQQEEINEIFPKESGNLHPGVALMYVALELAAQGHLRFNQNGFESTEKSFKRLMGIYPDLIPTMKRGSPTINILSNYTRFGLRQKTSFVPVSKPVSKIILEEKFPKLEKFFEWLMENGYFEEKEGVVGHPKPLTDKMRDDLRKEYPNDFGPILGILEKPVYRGQEVDYLKNTFIPQYLAELDKRSDDSFQMKKSKFIKKMIAAFHNLRPIDVNPDHVNVDDPLETEERFGPAINTGDRAMVITVPVPGPISVSDLLRKRLQEWNDLIKGEIDLNVQGEGIVYDQKINIDPTEKGTSNYLAYPRELWDYLLETSIDEIVLNAYESRGKRPDALKITLGMRIDDKTDQLIIEITDNGPGMPHNNPRNMATTKKGPPGKYGKGLNVIYHIVEGRLGGRVEIKTRRMEDVGWASSGTTVRILIPAHTKTASYFAEDVGGVQSAQRPVDRAMNAESSRPSKINISTVTTLLMLTPEIITAWMNLRESIYLPEIILTMERIRRRFPKAIQAPVRLFGIDTLEKKRAFIIKNNNETLEQVKKLMARDRVALFFAWSGDKLVGYLLAKISDIHPDVWTIDEVAVVKDFQGKQLGSRLFREAVEYLKNNRAKLDVKKILLHDGSQSGTTGRIATRLGFVSIGERDYEFNNFDTAMSSRGGIDLTTDKALTVQNNGHGIKFHIDPTMLQQLQNAPGFVPVIISVQPMTNLKLWLGLNDQEHVGQKIASL